MINLPLSEVVDELVRNNLLKTEDQPYLIAKQVIAHGEESLTDLQRSIYESRVVAMIAKLNRSKTKRG